MFRVRPQGGKWVLLAISCLFFIGFLVAATIILSLIPVYLSKRTVTLGEDEGIPIECASNITESSNRSFPLIALPPNALRYIEEELQKLLNQDPLLNGVVSQVEQARLVSRFESGNRKRQTATRTVVVLIINIRIFFRGVCRNLICRRTLIRHIKIVILPSLFIDPDRLYALIVNGTITTTTTTAAPTATATTTAATTTTTTTVPFTSGPSPSSFSTTTTTSVPFTSGPSPLPLSTSTTTLSSGRRRRQFLVESIPTTRSVSIGGILVISLRTANEFVDDLQQTHRFVSRLPLGVQVIPAVDGRQIDLYAALREQKISKVIYDQLIRQDRTIGGAHLTMGSLGCLESHVLAWNKVLQLNKPMLVLEDDAHLEPQLFDAILPHLLNSLPSDFSLLYFGNLVGKSFEPQLIDHDILLWKINGSSWGTFAYLISPLGAAVLLDNIYPVQAQVDSMIIDIASKQSLKTFMSKSLLVKTDNSFRRQSMTQVYLVPPLVIPRIFHFIWMGDRPLSSSLQKHMKQWKDLHPSWEIRLWTSQTLAASDLNMYNIDEWTQSTRGPRQAADILRYEVIYQYGGVFVDADFEPLKNIEPILHGVEAFVAHENEPFICNGLYGAIPGHELSRRLVINLKFSIEANLNSTVNQQTGPYHMTRQVQSLKDDGRATMKDGFRIFAPVVFFPYAWYEKDPGAPYDAGSYAVHHFRPIAEIERDFKEGH